jgi:hypothetical protein
MAVVEVVEGEAWRRCSRGLFLRGWVQKLQGKDHEREVSQVRMVIDSELYLDSGLFSGLAAMSEIRELLDDLYGNLT